MTQHELEQVAAPFWSDLTEHWRHPQADINCPTCYGFGLLAEGNLSIHMCQCVLDLVAHNYFAHGFGI